MNAPPHPADFLNEVLMPATGRSDGEVARLLGISLQVFYTILTREKPISHATAIMLGRLFNTGEGFWLKMQAEYDSFAALQNMIDSRVVPPDAPAVASSSGQVKPFRLLPKPAPANFSSPPDLSSDEFPPGDVATWGRVIHSNGNSSVG